MEEMIDYVTAQNSPQEWAIHFLLRHTECRTALMSGTNECDQSVEPPLDLGSRLQDVSATDKSGGPIAAAATPARATASGESCAARFSRAYAAARHSSVPNNEPGTASRPCPGPVGIKQPRLLTVAPACQ
jgi:hypothetical protein